MGILDHLTCLLRSLCADQEATVRTWHKTMGRFQIGKRVSQGCILSLCLLNFYLEYVMWNAGLDEARPKIKIAGRNISNLKYADYTVTRVYASRFLSRHNRDLEWWTLKPPRHVTALGSWTDRVIALRSQTDRVIALRQISVTALFYLEDSRKIHLRGMRARGSKDTKRRVPSTRERERKPFGSSFLYVSFFPLGLPCANRA